MDIKNLMIRIREADPEEKEILMNQIKHEFGNLPESEQEEVKKLFLESWDNKLSEAREVIEKIDLALEIEQISKYVSLSAISKEYFGKSKEWLYQRIKGYSVNGKKAMFTNEERTILSNALKDISNKLKDTSLKIA
ncbi:DUF5053 domain-containing protein [Parabacteroides sp. PF5-9]|uniref:DUF5053 domain-containing protein n=1 Tax=Parabacteroides sp. PF5-9 TaxID=1742404 RepID=UPI0024766F4E|nr:DUF5053 domain-containing protein [Parabacteroides sp. PF5-9]MDH6358533.1 hypothetical protein [Parabacteroides sp. PF5-9]